jgi:5-methylcytosine-specific restriction endonuclease McrA
LWWDNHPDARRIYNHNRRAKEKENGGKLSRGLAEKLFKLQRGKCPCCKLPLGEDCHLDHKMPVALGGANEDSNMQLLRAECNFKKNAKDPIKYMQSKGFLL